MERGLIAKTATGRLASRQILALLTLSTKFGKASQRMPETEYCHNYSTDPFTDPFKTEANKLTAAWGYPKQNLCNPPEDFGTQNNLIIAQVL